MSVRYNFDFSNTSSICNTYLRGKGPSQLIDVSKDLVDNNNLQIYLATLTYDPNVISKEDAWKNIHNKRVEALEILKSHGEIEFSVSTIETHHGKVNKKGTQKTLIDYPHIHICIGVSTSTGLYTKPQTISKWFMDEEIMPDIDVRSRKAKISSLDSLKYTLKDASHEKTYLSINGFELGDSVGVGVLEDDEDAIEKTKDNLSIPSVITGYNRLPEFQQLFKDLISFKREKQRIPMYIRFLQDGDIDEDENEDEGNENSSVSSSKASTQNSQNPESKRLAAQTPLLVATSIVKSYMYQNDLVISQNNNIYQKISGSRMSYRHYRGSCLEVCKEALSGKEHSSYNNEAQRVADFIEVKKLRDDTFLCPRIEFDIHIPWIEFQDCFYCPLINMAVKSQNKYPCYMYEPKIIFDDLKPLIDNFSEHSAWVSIIHNWGYKDEEIDVCSKLFQTMLQPRHHKAKSLNLVGDSNSGKTTLLMPFREIYPPDQIAQIKQTIGRFDASSFSNTALIFGEEVNPHILRPMTIALKALSGEEIPTEEKFGSVTKSHIQGRFVFTSNPNENYNDNKKENISNRMVELVAKRFINPVNMEARIIGERSIALVYVSTCFHSQKSSNTFYPVIEEDMDEIEALLLYHKRDIIDHSTSLPVERMLENPLFQNCKGFRERHGKEL